jgi:hypothetical protein
MGDSDTRRESASRAAAPGPASGPSTPTPYGPELACMHQVVYLGGYVPGVQLVTGDRYDVPFLEDRILVVEWKTRQVVTDLAYTEIELVEVGGPGIVKTGGGFVGGGFGVLGAAKGMGIASFLNTLSSRTTYKTVARIQAPGCELFWLHTRVDPEQLRIALSRPLAVLRSVRAASTSAPQLHAASPASASSVEELARLADMLEKGLLTREEFDLMKARLIGFQTD